MAEIIRAAVISGVGHQLRRPGTAAAIPAVAAATAALTATAVSSVDEAASGLRAEWAALRQRQAGMDQAEAEMATLRGQLDLRQAALETAQRELADNCAAMLTDAQCRGLEQGRYEAARELTERLAAQGERVNVVLNALNQSRRRALDEQEDMLVEIAFTAVCRMLGATAASRAGIASLVRSLTDAERDPAPLNVRLHPQDLALLTGDGMEFAQHIVLQADSGIELGGCLVASQHGTLDARLEQQVQQLRAVLLEVRGAGNKNEALI